MKNDLACEVYKKIFKNENSKLAYKECMKWLACNVVGKEEISQNISFQILKDHKEKIPTFIVHLYLKVEEEKCREMFCEKCRNMYSSFYQIQKMHCEECKFNTFRKHNKQYLEGMVQIYKKIFEGAEDEKNN